MLSPEDRGWTRVLVAGLHAGSGAIHRCQQFAKHGWQPHRSRNDSGRGFRDDRRHVQPGKPGGTIDLSKFGGWGDIGDPQQLGTLPIGWQPQLQGEMGYLVATKNFTAADSVTYAGTPYNLKGAFSRFHDFSIQFGGGPRLWFNDNFSASARRSWRCMGTRTTLSIKTPTPL